MDEDAEEVVARVRVVPGDPWRIEVAHPNGHIETAVVYDRGETDGVVRAYRDPATPPSAHHVSTAIRCLGYFVNGYSRLPWAISEGFELPLRREWPSQTEQRLREEPQRIAAAFADKGAGRGDMTLSLPTADLGDLLQDIRDAVPYCFEPAGAELLKGLAQRIDEAAPTPVVLPAELDYQLAQELRTSPLRGIREESNTRLDLLARLIEDGRPLSGAWPAVRETLGQALHEALARPGAEGIAARDELLAMVRHFADLHQDATHPDDTEQQRIQARTGD
ncbi:hypothetical protein ACF08N_35850 [Streptomyces sp. NPDC015127]|uniref:hypothetical protein n=1 Tax=Streptomyces sp. NPDC015127 TaxID=3364939 RepID=UPI0036FCF5D4